MKRATGVLIIFALAAKTITAATVNVPADQPTIQQAIFAANPHDTVLVADGVYSGDGNGNIDFGGIPLVVSSKNGPENCTIECAPSGSAAPSTAFLFLNGEDSTSEVAGFTISGGPHPHPFNGGGMVFIGSSPIVRDVVFVNGGSFGGTLCRGSSPTFLYCVFKSNIAGCSACKTEPTDVGEQAGGSALRCVDNSNPLLIGCTFEDNATDAQEGGALACYDSSPSLKSCLFLSNRSEYFQNGGAVTLHNSSPQFDSCTFRGNFSSLNGGALYMTGSSSPHFSATVFRGNSAGYGGGAVYSEFSTPQFDFCLFIENIANRKDCCSHGGAIDLKNSELLVMNSTFVGNGVDTTDDSQAPVGSVIYSSQSSLMVERSLLAYNGSGGVIMADDPATEITIACTDIFGNDDGDWQGSIGDHASQNGNFSADPLFCDPASGNFGLQANSPCTPVATACAAYVGAFQVGCVITDISASVEELLPGNINLTQNYPNPFNPETRIEFILPRQSHVILSVYNLLGQSIMTLLDQTMPGGKGSVIWTGKNSNGADVASGIYFYRIQIGGFSTTRKMVLLR